MIDIRALNRIELNSLLSRFRFRTFEEAINSPYEKHVLLRHENYFDVASNLLAREYEVKQENIEEDGTMFHVFECKDCPFRASISVVKIEEHNVGVIVSLPLLMEGEVDHAIYH